MDEITQVAVKRTMDPMQDIMDCLFKMSEEVLISDKILELIKKSHSYNMYPNGKGEVYTFHRRARGTSTIFSFVVTTGEDVNTVSNLEYTNELGVTETHNELPKELRERKVLLKLLDENII